MVDIKYDQHFLNDERIVRLAIREANIRSDDVIFEIGPGKGVLTKAILDANPKKLISVELDEMLKNELQILGRFPNFKLIFSNALEEISNHDFSKLIANIPYAITEPLYKTLIERRIPFAIILHGKTFYDTLKRRESKWNVYVNAFYDVFLLKEVNGDVFTPRTKTKSALVKLKLKESLCLRDKFIQNLFFNRLSKTSNAVPEALGRTFNLTKKNSKEKYAELRLDIELSDKVLDSLPNDKFCDILSIIDDRYLKL